MYKLIKKINEVKGFKIYKNDIFIGYYNRCLFFKDLKLSSDVDTTSNSLRLFNSFLFFDVIGNIQIYDIDLGQIIELNGYNPYPSSIENNEVICTFDAQYHNNKFTWKTCLYNISSKIKLKEYEFLRDLSIAYYLNKKLVIIYSGVSGLKSLSLLTGEYEWEIDLGTFGDIRKIIGVAGDNLWVSVNDAEYGKHHLVVIDVKSGKTIKSEKLDSRFADFGVMMTEKETVFSLNGRLGQATWLYEYDAQTMQALRAIEVPSLKEHTLGVKSFTVFKDNIYFTATDGSQIVANTVGVLDYNTLTLLWHDKVSPGNLMLDPPQVSDTHLYVLGAEGTLHIFEKEINV